jgi:hypothetical protein
MKRNSVNKSVMKLAKFIKNKREGENWSFNPLKTASLLPALGTLSLTLLAATPPASAIQLFAEGMQTPESLSEIPEGFGTLGGNYFAPDFRTDDIWLIPKTGGTATSFVKIPGALSILNGVFLPNNYGGKYIVAGDEPEKATLWQVDENGVVSVFAQLDVPNFTDLGRFVTPAIAPNGFSQVSGNDLFVTGQNYLEGVPGSDRKGVYQVTPTGVVTAFVEKSRSEWNPWGLAFAPADFGSFGGYMFVGDATFNRIYAIDNTGNVTIFADVPLLPGQGFVAQIGFSPTSFLDIGEPILFVSVTGSVGGGGTLGSILAYDSTGTPREELFVDLDKFDPRGFLFTDDNQMLINDASDPTYVATRDDFVPFNRGVSVPEPSSLLGFGIAIGLGALLTKREKTQAKK